MKVIVLGCGVSGLSTGIRLLEAGYTVSIWARDLPPHTTSNVAAAIWHPYIAFPVERVVAWGQRTFDVLCELSEVPETGVVIRQGLEVFNEDRPDPWWQNCVRNFRYALPEELPAGYRGGYIFEVPITEMSIYLAYLMRRFTEAGGEIVQREVTTLQEAGDECDIVANCTGLGAHKLLGDNEMYPVRGQIVRVSPPIERFMLDEPEDGTHTVTYIIPRSTDCVLGGTAQVGNWSLEPDMEIAENILQRCIRLAPELKHAQVTEHVVGLRPGRSAVRLEVETQPGGALLAHNYGHGGSGVTLSWGCAEDIVAQVVRHTR